MDEDWKIEIEIAKTVRKKAHDPYTNYWVGATLVAKSGKIYTGCNISNIGVQSICAERVAFVKAISEGEKEFERITVVGGKSGEDVEECLPCGHCRQFMSEFVNKDFKIRTLTKEYTIEELLPYQFSL